jgi:hypothetical protein
MQPGPSTNAASALTLPSPANRPRPGICTRMCLPFSLSSIPPMYKPALPTSPVQARPSPSPAQAPRPAPPRATAPHPTPTHTPAHPRITSHPLSAPWSCSEALNLKPCSSAKRSMAGSSARKAGRCSTMTPAFQASPRVISGPMAKTSGSGTVQVLMSPGGEPGPPPTNRMSASVYRAYLHQAGHYST